MPSTIRLEDETIKLLRKIGGNIQAKTGEKMTDDKTIKELIKLYEKHNVKK